MSSFTAFFDACVLYPAPLRDLLISLATSGLFRAKWSDDVHDEWIRNLLANRTDISAERLQKTRELMDGAVPDCLVTGYGPLIPNLDLPDKNDNHVLAAAIVGRADVIVTANLKHFPQAVLDAYGIQAEHPDEFIEHLIDLALEVVIAKVKEIRARLKNPEKTAEEYLETLSSQGLVRTVQKLEEYKDLL